MSLPPPKHIKVGPYYYEVYFMKPPFPGASEEFEFGASEHGHLQIFIDNTVHLMVQIETLCHEILHCIFYNTGMAMEWGHTKEERYIRVLSPWLVDILRDNPDFTDFLRQNV